MEAMKLNKNALEDAATGSLDEIRRQREELDRREAEVLARLVRQDEENRAFMGALLQEEVGRILGDDRLSDGTANGEEQDEQESADQRSPVQKAPPEQEQQVQEQERGREEQEPTGEQSQERQEEAPNGSYSPLPSEENGKSARAEIRGKAKVPKMNITCTIA